jgi:hypothetical protein
MINLGNPSGGGLFHWLSGRFGKAAGTGVLVWLRTEGEPVRFPLDTSRRILIGRDPGREIRIPQKTVSGLHAVIYHETGAYWLLDAGSTNGTHVRDRRLEPHVRVKLRHGDKIRLADEMCQFVCEEAGPRQGGSR